MTEVFISAQNPGYKRLPLRANNARQYQLLHDLQEAGATIIYAAKFADKKTGYEEDSFYTNVKLSDAVRLAKYYGQESILIDGVGILNVNTGKVNPQIGKATGLAAEHRSAFSVIFERKPKVVSYDIDFSKTRRLMK